MNRLFRPATRALILLGLLVSASGISMAQDQTNNAQAQIWVSYYGELATHPGFAAGAKFRIFDGELLDLSVGPVVGFYVHPRNHTGLFIDAEVEGRLNFPGGLFFSLGASAGYYHTLLGGDELYVRDDDGSVATATDWGRPSLKAGASTGLGWDMEPRVGIPLQLFSRLDIFAQYPFNNSILPHAALLTGAAYQLGRSE